MKKILSLLALIVLSCMGAWADNYTKAPDPTSTPSSGYFVIQTHNQSGNYTSNYLYDNVSELKVKAAAISDDYKYVWYLKNVNGDTYTIQNVGTGHYMYVNSSANNNAILSLVTSTNLSVVVKDGTGLNIKNGERYVDCGYSGNNPVSWTGDGTSSKLLQFYPVTVDIEALKTSKISEIESFGNAPVLFSESDVNTAKTAINAAEVTSENFMEKYNAAMNTLYRSAEGKKFSYASDAYSNGTYYMCANGAATGLSTTTDVSAVNVFELVYQGAGNLYKVKSSKYNAFLNSANNGSQISTNATGVNYNVVPTSTSNKIALQFDGTVRGIHHQNSGHAPVAWDTSADANKWTVASISDEEFNTLNSKVVKYTVTDVAGTEYTGQFTGSRGELPSFTGVTGYSFSNGTWADAIEEGVDYTYTANITFPFPVSKAGTDNWTYIKGQPNSASCYWYAGDSNVKARKDALPTNADGENAKWKWAIYPTLTDNAFSFRIKNQAKDQFITATFASNVHNATAVTFSNEGVALTYDGKFGGSNARYLSVNTSNTTDEQDLGTWTSHGGCNVGFVTPADFEALMNALKSAYHPIGSGLGEYQSGDLDMDEYIRAVLVIGGSQYLTAAEFTALTSTLNGYTYTINQPETGKFYTFKNAGKFHKDGTNHYWNGTWVSTSVDKNTIFYLDGNNHLIQYGTGFFANGTRVANEVVAEPQTYTFTEGKTTWGTKNDGVNVAANGDYCIHGSSMNGSLMTWEGSGSGTMDGTADNWAAWIVEEVTELPVTIASSGYSTFNSPVATAIPAGVKAYTAKVDVTDTTNPVIVYTKVEDVIPANSPVFLAGEAGAAVSFNLDYDNDGAALANNDFEGTVAAMAIAQTTETVADKYYYVLSNGQFKFATGKINGFRAYLNVALPYTAAAASNFRVIFADDLATGIDAVDAIPANAEIFDLQGRRVNAARNGLYIVNGKKVIR